MAHFRFGTFIPPIHPVGQNPTLCLDRDLETIVHLDRMGYDEAWIGEHHSAGTELIAAPELVIVAAAERTKRIKLGTGVSSLPYHHPFIFADRFMQLHHMTRGRAMLGAGPGALPSDAFMMGIDPARQRDMMEEALDCVLRLFRGETVTYSCDWFKLNNAKLQLKPYGGEPIEVVTASMMSPSGPRAAGRLGTGLLSLAATAPDALNAATKVWQTWSDMADQHGQTARRDDWRMIALMHIAETREHALADVQFGINEWIQYFEDVAVLPMVPPERKGDAAQFLVEQKRAVIGTPDDCLAQINAMREASGGFGCLLVTDHNWAPFARKLNSYELIARYVFPKVNALNTQRSESYDWTKANRETFMGAAHAAAKAQIDRHAADVAARSAKNKGAAAE